MGTVILNVTAGRGPRECRIAVGKVVAEIVREAEARAISASVSFTEDPDGAGSASAIVVLDGNDMADFVRMWLGSVQWIARSAVRREHARKNWFVAVRRADPADPGFTLAPSDVRFEAMRAGGPGGQHQNRTESAVRAVHLPTGVSVVARDQRSQHRNKAVAFQRLRDVLAARDAEERARQARRDWTERISVERGNPIRVYRDEAFSRVR
jgi:peptide chain release factor